MALPYMSDKGMFRPTVRTQFGGLNNNLSARDGEIVWMENMSSREFPLLRPRTGRTYMTTISQPYGIGARDHLYWVSGTNFYYDGVLKGTVAKSLKQFAAMGNMICIFPDKKYYDIDSGTFGNMAVEQELSGVSFQNGTYAEVTANANTIYKAGAAWNFRPGDAITIEGSEFNDGTYILREVSGDYLRFYEGTFQLPYYLDYTAEGSVEAGDYYGTITWNGQTFVGVFTLPAMSEGDTLHWYFDDNYITATIGGVTSQITVVEGSSEGRSTLPFTTTYIDYTDWHTITVGREIPDLDYVCVNENRLWGCKGDTIYASALGDPFNFNVFDGLSTDSWQSAVPDEGDFTACVSYGGYPIFFKENSICKVQGDKPSNFQWTLSSRFGVKEGSSWSLAVAGETLFYLSRAGICAYNGGAPRVISEPLGANIRWASASAGSDGIRYYVSLRDYDDSDVSGLYVFDTRYGVWHREDECQGMFAFCVGTLYMIAGDRLTRINGDSQSGSPEPNIQWTVEFADSDNFFETTDSNSQNKKGPLRILIRAQVFVGTSIDVYIRYDDGYNHLVGTLRGDVLERKKTYILPLILRRCDHYRLILEGHNNEDEGFGDAVIYSIAVERYSGSQFQGSSSVSLPNQGLLRGRGNGTERIPDHTE